MNNAKRAVVVGYGSIGRRHDRLLRSLGLDVSLVTSQRISHCQSFTSLNRAIEDVEPLYVVIASTTNRHITDIETVLSHGFGGCLLVEKPVCMENQRETLRHLLNSAGVPMYVGYNLRFSGVALAAREFVTANEIVAADFQVASYLPNWRSNVEYRKSSSAREATGGGVLRDLSHELDLASWLLGSMEIEHSYSDKLSDLEIETDDYFEGMFESINGARVNLRLSSFSKIPSRTFRLLSKSNCFVGDFGTNQYRIGDEVISLNESVDDSYLRMHRAVLSNDKSVLCTASEAYMIVDLIARCRQAAPKTSS